jgi:methylaspartate ammonia-lyase
MKIVDVICSPGRTGFFFDDQRAIKSNAEPDGATYRGQTVTEGFTKIRQAGESISVMLVLDDGQVAYGDCAAVQYSGAGGRDPLFLAMDFIPVIQKHIAPMLMGREVSSFRKLAEEADGLTDPANGRRLHTAIRYGVTQALLDAAAKARQKMMAEVAAEEYGTEVSDKPIPIFTQSGDNRYDNVDKMILKRADVLPHALINNVKTKLGEDGGLLLEYVRWLRERVYKLRPDEAYRPVLHIDVYGTMGLAFGGDFRRIAAYLGMLEKAATPLKLRIEGPMDMEGREAQMQALAELTRIVDSCGIGVEIVADEWCNTLEDCVYFADNRAGHMIQIKTPDLGGINNTIEAVLYCKRKGVGAYQGGTCNETDRSAQVCVHAAMASKPDQILAKPGMGVDEGFMIVYNEMQRILALRSR